MIINVKKLTDFRSGHSRKAEVAVMTALCFLFDLEPGEVTKGNSPEFDFRIGHTTVELKISSKGTNGLIELSKADGRPGGLSATKANIHAFLNPASDEIAKLRLIHTYELQHYYNRDCIEKIVTATAGDKIGSVLAPFNIREFNDLFVAQCDCETVPGRGLEFDTQSFKVNHYGRTKIHDYIR
jgi:hypothetical protein